MQKKVNYVHIITLSVGVFKILTDNLYLIIKSHLQ